MAFWTNPLVYVLIFFGLCLCHLVFLDIGVYDTKATHYPRMDRVELPDPQVPLTELLAAEPSIAPWHAARHEWDESGDNCSDSEIFAMLAGKAVRNDEAIALWRKQHELGIAATWAMLARSGDRLWTYPVSQDANFANLPLFELGEPKKMAKDILMECRLAVDNHARCVEMAVMGKSLGNKLVAYDSSLIHYLVTGTIRGMIDQSALVAARSCLQARDSVRLEQLAAYYPDGFADRQQASLANAIRAEFHIGFNTVVWLRDQWHNQGEFADMMSWSKTETLAWYWTVLRVQPNRHASQLAGKMDALIQQLSVPLATHSLRPTKAQITLWHQFSPTPRAGLAMFDKLCDDLAVGGNADTRIFAFYFRGIAQNTLCRTVLAISRYRMANNGSLPASLADLVPVYLPAVPQDPLDAKPLRYDAASGRLWSIGTDCKDDGGIATESASDFLPGFQTDPKNPDLLVDLRAFFPRSEP